MRCTRLLCGLVLVLTTSLHAQPTTQRIAEDDVAPTSVLIDVVPPDWIKNSSDPMPLWQAIAKKHVIQLKDPALLHQVLRNEDVTKGLKRRDDAVAGAFDKAINARVVPGTVLIEVYIDSSVAGEDAPRLADAIVKQHFENDRQLAQNQLLERSVQLNNLKQKYQFRLRDLQAEIREKTIDLSAATQPADAAENKLARYQLEQAKDVATETRELLATVNKSLDHISESTQQGELRLLRSPVIEAVRSKL